MVRNKSFLRITTFAIILLLALLALLVSINTQDKPALAIEYTDSGVIIGSVTLSDGDSLVLPQDKTLTIEPGGALTIQSTADLSDCKGKIIVQGDLSFIGCTWASEYINIVVDGGTLLVIDSVISDTSDADNPPIIVNSGSLNIQTDASASFVSSRGNYAIEVLGGEVTKDDTSTIKRSISTTEQNDGDTDSYKQVVYLAVGTSFICPNYTVNSTEQDVYLTGKSYAEEMPYHSTIKVINAGFTSENFDALRIDNGKSIIFMGNIIDDPYLSVAINNNDGIGGTDGIKNYNKQNMVATASITGGEEGAEYTFQWLKETEGAFAELVGETTAELSIIDVADSGAYKCVLYKDIDAVAESDVVNLTIDPKMATLDWADTALTYNGFAQKPTATVGNLIGQDACEVTVDGAETNQGAYTATAIALSNDNYALPEDADCDFAIAPAEIALLWNNLSFDYDGNAHLPIATAYISELGEGILFAEDVCTVTVEGAQIDKGSHIATATALSNDNYALPAVATTAFTISPKTASLVWANTALTYNGASQAPTATVGNLIGQDACEVTVDGAKTNQGAYTATATALSNDNYALPAVATTAFTISPLTATLVWADTALTYNGASQAPTATVGNLIGQNACEVTVDGAETNQGAHTATATALSNDNYALPEDADCDFAIAPAEIALLWTNLSFDYDGNAHLPTATAYISELGEGILFAEDVCTVTVEGAQIDKGSHIATATALSNANYKLPQDVDVEYTINAAMASGFRLAQDITYDGTYHEVILICEGVSEDVQYTVFIEGDTSVRDVGNYSVTVIGISNPNITIVENTLVEFSVASRRIEYTLEDNFSVYGDPIIADSELRGSVTSDTKEVILGEAGITLSTDIEQGWGVGFYNITCNWDNLNYDVEFINDFYSYEITPREIEVSFGAHEGFIFNNAEHYVDVNVINLYLEDAVEFDYIASSPDLVYENGKVSATNVGHYEIAFLEVYNDGGNEPNGGGFGIMGGFDFGNYVLKEEKTLTFDIAKRTVAIEFIGTQGLIYDGTSKDVQTNLSNLVEDASAYITMAIYKNGTPADVVCGAGSYRLEATGFSEGGDNYALPAKGLSATFSVAQATVGIAFANYTNLIYNGNPHIVTASANGIYQGDTVNPVISGNTATNAGNYTAMVTGLDNPNYKLPSTGWSINYTIQKRAIQVHIYSQTSTYGEPFAELTYGVISNIVEGDELGITLTKEEGNDVGLYDIYVEWNHNPNYTPSFIGGESSYFIRYRFIEYTIDAAESTYGEQLEELTLTLVSGSVADIAAPGITLTTTAAYLGDVGSYPITADYTNKNYYITIVNNGEELYKITPRPISVAIADATSVYGNSLVPIEVEITEGSFAQALDSLNLVFSYNGSEDAPINVGEYDVFATADNLNYYIAIEGGVYTITARPISVIITAATKTYGDVTTDFTYEVFGAKSGDDLGITLYSGTDAATPYINVGTYDIVGECANTNYFATFIEGANAYTIVTRELGISFADYTDLVYNGTSHTVTATASNVVQGDDMTLILEGNTNTNVGTYTAKVIGIDGDTNGNYSLPSVTSIEYSVGKATIGISFGNYTNLIYNGGVHTVTANATGTFGEDNVVLVIKGNTATYAGDYTATVTGLDNANYKLPSSGFSISYTIQSCAIKVAVCSQDSVYGAPFAQLTYAITTGSVATGDDLGITLTKAAGYRVGTYDIKADWNRNPNYSVEFDNATYTISAKTVTLAFSNHLVGGQNRVYKKSTFDINIGVEGVVSGDDVYYDYYTLVLTRNGNSVNTVTNDTDKDPLPKYYVRVQDFAGDYTLYIGGIKGDDTTNYSFGGAELTYTIEQRELGLQFLGAQNHIYNGAEQSVGVVASNVAAGDEITLILEGNANTNAGAYLAKVVGIAGADKDNYRLPATTSWEYTIYKARPTISVGSNWFEFTYKEGTNYSIEASATNGEPILYHLVSGANLTPIPNSFSNVGFYKVRLTTAETANYYAAEYPTEISVVILCTLYYNSLDDLQSHVRLSQGGAPDAQFFHNLAPNQQQAMRKYLPSLRSNFVGHVYNARLLQHNIPIKNTGIATITMELPDMHSAKSSITVMYFYNGAYYEKTVPVEYGTITFDMEELGEFAILSDKDLTPRVSDKSSFTKAITILAVVGGAIVVFVVVISIIRVRKRKLATTAANNKK